MVYSEPDPDEFTHLPTNNQPRYGGPLRSISERRLSYPWHHLEGHDRSPLAGSVRSGLNTGNPAPVPSVAGPDLVVTKWVQGGRFRTGTMRFKKR